MADPDDMDAAVARAAGLVGGAKRVVALTGAGISTDSGIPDFRGPQGVWTKNPGAERTSTVEAYIADVEVRRMAWRNRVSSPAWGAQPNAGHRALVDLERTGRLGLLATQNIDELHQLAGSDPSLVCELHGTMRWSRCWRCGDRRPMPEALERVRAGEDDPACLVCGGILKSDTVMFGQSLDPAVIDRAQTAVEGCDLLLAVGTTLNVFPAAALVPLAKAVGASIVIVNGSETGYDRLADVVVRGSISDVLPRIVAG